MPRRTGPESEIPRTDVSGSYREMAAGQFLNFVRGKSEPLELSIQVREVDKVAILGYLQSREPVFRKVVIQGSADELTDFREKFPELLNRVELKATE